MLKHSGSSRNRVSAHRTRWLLAVASVAVLLLAFIPTAATAQSADAYPGTKPVRLLVPYAPGGATDIIARQVAAKLPDVIGGTFVVENRVGASGNLALEAAARAAPDGYTLLVGNVSTNAINEITFVKSLTVKPTRDLVGITKLVEIPHILAASTALPVNSVAELVEYARKNPGKLNFASAGPGTYPELDMWKFAGRVGVKMVHIPYKTGAAGMIPALMSDECQIAFINLASTLSQIRAGKLKVLATAMPARLAELPNVPTLTELGYPDIGTNAWQAMFAPVATPRPVVEKIYNAVAQVLTKPEMKEALAKQMLTVSLSKSPQEWTAQVREETAKWAEVVRANNVTVE